jgi:hypothetical protein
MHQHEGNGGGIDDVVMLAINVDVGGHVGSLACLFDLLFSVRREKRPAGVGVPALYQTERPLRAQS